MEEEEKSLESKEDRLKDGADPPEELKVEAKGLGDLKNGEDEKNLKEVKDREERKNVKEIKNGEEDKYTEETKVGDEKESGDSQDIGEKKNLEKTENEEKKKEVEVQNGNVMKFVVERKNNEEDSNPIDDISVKELKNGKDEEGVEEIKDDEHSKNISGGKVEESVLVQVKENDGGKARKEAKDIEMVGAEDVVEKEAADVIDEGKLVVREGEEERKDNAGNDDKTVGDNQKAESLKRKRDRGQRPSETREAKKNGDSKEDVKEKEVKGSGKRSKEVLSTPVVSSSERPVRERKTVERLVEVIEKGPDSTVIIEKGRGIPLIEIPNVAYNMATKKPAELKFLHQTLFGRKGKAVNFRSNLLRFSGFAWHESEEKQRAKIKEKLDKGVKETLLDLCDLFDLTVSKTNTKKDEIIVKLLDFLEAPKAMTDVRNAEDQSSKSRKRERAPKADASKSSGDNFEKRSRQKHDKTEDTPNSEVKSSHDTEDGDDDEDSEDEVRSHSESDAEEKELEEKGYEEKDKSEVDADLTKGRKVKKSPKWKEKQDVTKYPKKQVSSDTVKKVGSNYKKTTPKTDGKSTLKTSLSEHPKAEKGDDTSEKVFSRMKKDAESPKKSNSKSISKEKSSGKASKSKAKSGKEEKSGPNKAELRNSICEILKEVDFNTATFTDILKQLASQYKVDLTPRKAAIKLLIQEELTKMADETEDSEDEDEMQ